MKDEGLLSGQVALITGGAGGIGAAIAREFVAEDARVAVLDLPSQSEAAVALAEELGPKARFLPCDVTEVAACQGAVSDAAKILGPPSILVNNAGISVSGGLEEISESDWDRLFAVNVKSVMLMGREALPHLRATKGTMINVASESAFLGLPMHPGYCASKAAVVHLTRCLAVRHASEGIRINALCPGTIDTALYRGFLAQQEEPERVHADVVALHPLGLGTARDIARSAVFLASEDAAYITGAPMLVDGGSTAA